ncbi:hypothetical protein HJC23_004977 [Cyclotella cryptica]|uniref:TRAM domain-containing protein n=1 Tax=Cyclotella cryptica TaxID=29204 RepID=A0ABD3NHS2_9STRA
MTSPSHSFFLSFRRPAVSSFAVAWTRSTSRHPTKSRTRRPFAFRASSTVASEEIQKFQKVQALSLSGEIFAKNSHVFLFYNILMIKTRHLMTPPTTIQYHDVLTVTVESLTNLGFGIARVPIKENDNTILQPEAAATTSTTDEDSTEQKKWVVFIPNVIPGETCRIRIYRNHATYSDADLIQVLTPSEDRIEPKCGLANVCGGCQYQHVKIERQRAIKTQQVQELFEDWGLKRDEFPKVLETLEPSLRSTNQKKDKDSGNSLKSYEIGPIGFKEKASRRLVDVPYCHIATPAINTALEQIRNEKRMEAIEERLKKPSKGATLLLRDAEGVVETNHTEYVDTIVNGLTFRFQAGNFFQNNPYMLPKMVDLVVSAATAPSPKGEPMTHLIDCYCGSGLFALGSSSFFDVCVGIEVNAKAVEEAKGNAALNGIENCDFVSASAEAIFQSQDPVSWVGRECWWRGGCDDNNRKTLLVKDFPRDNTVVVVDPPRKGCSPEFLEQLDQYRPARVVYMSCDPATQARDASFLVGHGYKIMSVQPFDLFPQTRHIECLAVFDRVIN